MPFWLAESRCAFASFKKIAVVINYFANMKLHLFLDSSGLNPFTRISQYLRVISAGRCTFIPDALISPASWKKEKNKKKVEISGETICADLLFSRDV